jgi:hypothetical protein
MESMHLWALSGEMVLTPGIALKFATPTEKPKSFFLFRRHMTKNLLLRRKTKQNKPQQLMTVQ